MFLSAAENSETEVLPGEGVRDAHPICILGGRRQGAWLPLHRLWPFGQEQLQGGRVLHQEYS